MYPWFYNTFYVINGTYIWTKPRGYFVERISTWTAILFWRPLEYPERQPNHQPKLMCAPFF